ncbi:MAG: LppX_LprAFG lipoprotein [Actinomycetota bacterium]|nr:LppX_LprAFG lipoprotein [Actinomycetota bacterium]
MRKHISLFFVAIILVCFAGCGPSADQILKDSSRASKGIKTVHFTMEMKTKLPRAPVVEGKVAKRVLVQKSEGEYDLRTNDFRVTTKLAGMDLRMLQVEGKQYWEIAGNWYQTPEAAQFMPPITTSLSVSQYVKYFKQLKKHGTAKIDGEACYHIEGIPDMKELVKQPGITDLMKDPSGKQIRTIDEVADIRAEFHYYIRKGDMFFKRSQLLSNSRATNELIKEGYAEPGDRTEDEVIVTFSQFNRRLDLKVPQNVKPWPSEWSTG